MLGVIKSDVVMDISRIHVPTPEELAEMEAQQLAQQQAQAEAMRLNFGAEMDFGDEVNAVIDGNPTINATDFSAQTFEVPESRNAPCPCGSGLKYKQCHGKI